MPLVKPFFLILSTKARGRCARQTNIAQLSRAASVTQRMPREQARFSLATWRNHEISASRRARVSERSAQTCVEDRAVNRCAAIFKPPVPLLYLPILSSTKAFYIISFVSVQLLPRLKQNLMQIRWSVRSVIFNCKQMRRTEKARWT